MEEVFKTFEDYHDYAFSNHEKMLNTKTGKFLNLTKDNRFQVSKDGKRKKIALSKLKQKYFSVEIEYLEGEIFFVIDGFPNYEISNKGRIYNNETGVLLKPRKDANGYYKVDLYKNKKKTITIHRLVAIAFIANPKNLPEVDHINRIKTDNRLENLRWVSSSENRINTLNNREYPKHIYKIKKENREYWLIQIRHPNFKFCQLYRCDKYSLEQVKEKRNKIYKENGIPILD
jgi:hypothetical protein